MRLLVISNLFFPDRGGGASVFSDMCAGLVERGWEVTVYATHPYYPEWRRKSEASPWRIQVESWRGVQVLRHGIYVPSNPSRLIPRLLYEASFAVSLLRSLGRGPRYDAVMVYCPLLGGVMFAAVRKLFRGEPLWLNIQDIPADAASASGISRSAAFDRLAQGVQRWLFNRADVWSTISPVMLRRVETLRRDSRPVHLCPNWLNGSLADHVTALPSKEGRVPNQPPALLYAGNIGKKQGLLEALQFLERTKTPVNVRIHGDGGEASTVREWVKATQDPRFVFGDFLDEQGFVRALHVNDLFLISEKPGSGASFVPSKLIAGIATGTPILAICDESGPLGQEMTEYGLGLVVPWPEMEKLPERLAAFVSDSAGFAACQRRCLERSRVYQSRHAVDTISALLKDFVKGATRSRSRQGDSSSAMPSQ